MTAIAAPLILNSKLNEPYELGLDCGTNSLGWACVSFSPMPISNEMTELGSGRIIASGVRVFPEAVEKPKGTPKNAVRRSQRAARKNHRQRCWRRDKLTALLVTWGWMPTPPVQPDLISAFFHELGGGRDPYSLRNDGLHCQLAPAGFCRILLHMVKRRGFQSNRKVKGADDGKVLSSIQRVATEIHESGKPTLGAFLHHRRMAYPLKPVRNRDYLGDELMAESASRKANKDALPEVSVAYQLFTRRSMYAEELGLLWQKQAGFLPQEYTQERFRLVCRYVLEQRPLKAQRHLVGNCPHIPTEKRCPMAYLQSQEARIRATLNTLRIINPDPWASNDSSKRFLTLSEREALFAALQETKELDWDRARRILKLHDGEKFNIETGGRAKKLKGNTTLAAMRKALPRAKVRKKSDLPPEVQSPAAWDDLSQKQQHAIIRTLVYEDHEGRAAYYIAKHGGVDAETAARLASTVHLEEGHFSFSSAALDLILPHLRTYDVGRVNIKNRPAPALSMTEAIEAAGFSHLKTFTQVPQLPMPPDLRNPVVNKALYQVRKVVNAIIRRHGLPKRIRIELARDMKRTKSEREEIDKEIAKRDNARQLIRPHINQLLRKPADYEPRHDDYLKYELWMECGKTCPYSLKTIGAEQLYSPEVQLEHIIPWSRCFDDTRGNKTLCFWRHNQCKGRLTPREAFSETMPELYTQICQHVRHCVDQKLMKKGKAARFEWTDVDREAGNEEFTNRHLSDTRYLSRAIHDYLKQLNPDPEAVFVQVAKGDTTAVLRRCWGLNDSAGTAASACVLPPLLSEVATGTKTREDHRHHALDAIVIALTTPAILQGLSRLSGQRGRDSLYDGRLHLPLPWRNFRDAVRETIAGITVSHDPTRKATGALHLDTAYGSTGIPGQYVYRVKLASLTDEKLDPVKGSVRDKRTAEILRAHLALHGGNVKKAFSVPVYQADGVTPIRKVRITINKNVTKGMMREGDAEPFRYHELKANHHIVILHNLETDKWEERVVTLIEAAERKAKGLPIVRTNWGTSHERALVLHENDLVELDEGIGRAIYRVQQLSSCDYVFRRHNIARIDKEMKEVGRRRFSSTGALRNANPRQVELSPLGDILPRR